MRFEIKHLVYLVVALCAAFWSLIKDHEGGQALAAMTGGQSASGARFEAAFSPHGGGLDLVLKGIRSAHNEIVVAAYSFTSKPIAEALVDARSHGVSVMVVADKKENSGRYTAVNFVADHGIEVRLDGNYPIFHHKFMLIDGKTLETGSFNYSAQAAKANAENVLLIENVPQLVTTYRTEWDRLWQESQPVAAR